AGADHAGTFAPEGLSPQRHRGGREDRDGGDSAAGSSERLPPGSDASRLLAQELTRVSDVGHTERLLEDHLADTHAVAQPDAERPVVADLELDLPFEAGVYGGRCHVHGEAEPCQRTLAFDPCREA